MGKVELKMLIPPNPTTSAQHTGKQIIIQISLLQTHILERN